MKSDLQVLCEKTPTWKYLTSLFIEFELGSQKVIGEIKNQPHIHSVFGGNVSNSLNIDCYPTSVTLSMSSMIGGYNRNRLPHLFNTFYSHTIINYVEFLYNSLFYYVLPNSYHMTYVSSVVPICIVPI